MHPPSSSVRVLQRLLSVSKTSSQSSSDAYILYRSHHYNKQTENNKCLCSYKSGQTCRIKRSHTCLAMYVQTNVGLLCCFGSGCNAGAMKGVRSRLLACWNCGFETRWGRGCLSVVSAVCNHRSLQRADHSCRGVLPTVVCLLCDPESS